MRKMQAFRDTYLVGPTRVLDVGAMAHENDEIGYRELFGGTDYDYVGLDVAPGKNVDIAVADPFSWVEVRDESYDAVICGQVFEHNPYPWITMAEIARVLRPGGFFAMVAPSRGSVHRYPLDCWRFYPDSGAALCSYVGLRSLESFVEPSDDGRTINGAAWGDFFVVAQRPSELDLDHLRRVVETRRPAPDSPVGIGPAIKRYESTLDFQSAGQRVVRSVARRVRGTAIRVSGR
jgi:SAM-dependent methyltransferase